MFYHYGNFIQNISLPQLTDIHFEAGYPLVISLFITTPSVLVAVLYLQGFSIQEEAPYFSYFCDVIF